MTITDLRRELADQAADIPDLAAIRAEVDRRVSIRTRHRRTRSLIAVAAAVVLVAGGAGIAGSVLVGRGAGPARPVSPRPVVPVPNIPLPTGSDLVRIQLQPVSSPVTASTLPATADQTLWVASGDLLGVMHYPASDGQAAPTSYGYVIGPHRDPEVYDSTGASAGTVATVSARVAGHPAFRQSAPTDAVDALGMPATQRLSWQLSDGRWIHVFVRNPAKDTDLDAFAAGIVERPTQLYRAVGIGFTLPGLTSDTSANLQRGTGSTLYLCRPGVNPVAPVGGATAGRPDPLAGCIAVNVTRSDLPDLDDPRATRIAVGGTVTEVNPTTGRAVADIGDGVSAVVSAPSAHLSAADLAALVASVRISATVTLLPAITSVRPSAAPAERGQAGTDLGRPAGTTTGTVPSAAVAATTTLGPPSGTLVSGAPVRFPVPFTLTAPQDRTAEVSWGIGPSTGLVTVNFPGWTYGAAPGKDGMHGGAIRYDGSGLHGVPGSATATMVLGHQARLWDDGSTRIGWTLPDGSGITVSGDTEDVARQIVTMVSERAGEVSVGAAPALVPPSLEPARLEAGADPAAPMRPSAVGAFDLVFCPDGTPAGTEHDSPNCLDIARESPGTGSESPLDRYQDWRAADVDGATVLIAPDGHAAAAVTADQSVLTVIAGSDVPVTAADLAAILLSVPG